MSEKNQGKKSAGAYIGDFFAKYMLLLITVAVALVFGAMNPQFFKFRNMMNIVSSACVMGIAGIGITCINAADEMDFSAGTEVAAGACFMAWLLSQKWCRNYFLALVLTLVLMTLFGLLNAFINIRIGVPAFIATMGTSYVVKGFLKSLVGGQGIYSNAMWPSYFTFMGQGYLFGIIPMPAVVLAVLGVLMLIYTERTRSGRYIYAVGCNSTACKYIGISANKQRVKGFVICAVMCGIGGIVQGSMLNGGIATMGDSVFMMGLTALMWGVMFMKKGVFNVPGTLVGTLFIAIINNGMVMAGASGFAKNVVQGGMLLIGVCMVSVMKLTSQKMKIIKKKEKAFDQTKAA